MNIVMFSINPLFPDYIMGGAPKHLQQIALHLGRQGHYVTILCTRPDAEARPFTWHSNVRVLPELDFNQPFPQPYAVPAYDMANTIQAVGEHLEQADRFYMHDGEFLFPYAYQSVPTVVSLRDNIYPETLLGGFLFNADKLILISEYSRNYYLNTVGRFFPELNKRIEVIYNGLDWERFKPSEPKEILEFLGLRPSDQPIILHPHRPEPSKGVFQTLEVVDALVHRHGISNLLTLIPRWHDVQASADLQGFYRSIERTIAERKLSRNVLFHEWIPQDLMPQYYSLGTVTLSLGHFVESFGNAVYESIGCGTPSIVSRVSTHRELVPDELMYKVDFDDNETAAAIAVRIINNRESSSAALVDYVKQQYSIDRQVKAYENAIVNAKLAIPMNYRHQKLNSDTRFRLAPWCYGSETRGVFHDFHATYRDLSRVLLFLKENPTGLQMDAAAQQGVREDEILELYELGYLVPVSEVSV